MLGKKLNLNPTNQADEVLNLSKKVTMDRISMKDLEKAGVNEENKFIVRDAGSNSDKKEWESKAPQKFNLKVKSYEKEIRDRLWIRKIKIF